MESEVSLVRPSDIHLIFRSLMFCDASSSKYLQGFDKVYVEPHVGNGIPISDAFVICLHSIVLKSLSDCYVFSNLSCMV